jgi:alpha,alpha-trehalase
VTTNRLNDNPEIRELLGHFDRLRPGVTKPPAGFIKYPYCIPGGFYQQQWDWDGFFIAAHLAARTPARPEFLKYWALNFLSAALPDGEISACVKPEGPTPGHASLTMKPFLAQGVELGARLLGDYDWVEEHYASIVAIATRRKKSHYNPEYGLFAWDDAMQSGADNNPAVGNDPDIAPHIAACDVNTFQWREYRALERIAQALGRNDDAAVFHQEASALKKAINGQLWDGEKESYWNVNCRTHLWQERVSYSNFVPLWAGIVPAERASAMIRRYLWNDEHLLTPHGLRTLSKQDPEYNNVNMIVPYSNWQGPVWPIANYFYFMALVNYGFTAEAAALVKRLARLYLADIAFCGSLHENYDAETGRPLAPSASQSAGREGGFVGWNLLLQDMIEMADGRPNLLAFEPAGGAR